MKKLWLTILLMPAICFAEFAVVHDELKDGSKMEVAHVDAGAVSATGTVAIPVESGAVKVDGTLTNNFQQPLATVSAPIGPFSGTMAAGAVPVHVELNNFPHGLELVHMDEGAVPVTVNIKMDLGPVAKELAAVIQPAKGAITKAQQLYDDRWKIACGGLFVAILVGWFFHAHGNRKVIAALKQVKSV